MTEEEAAFATWSSPRRTESLKEGGKITSRKDEKNLEDVARTGKRGQCRAGGGRDKFGVERIHANMKMSPVLHSFRQWGRRRGRGQSWRV